MVAVGIQELSKLDKLMVRYQREPGANKNTLRKVLAMCKRYGHYAECLQCAYDEEHLLDDEKVTA
jgi:hypothetical protein